MRWTDCPTFDSSKSFPGHFTLSSNWSKFIFIQYLCILLFLSSFFSVGFVCFLCWFLWPLARVNRANLSDSYFTNRQDRYVLLENCSQVADFFSQLVEAVSDTSLQLQPDDSVSMLEGMVHPYQGPSVCLSWMRFNNLIVGSMSVQQFSSSGCWGTAA